ncbi:MAG: hypothetical protein R3244_13280, partial [Thermoanaerobaculia bacterium]|nr:hypothetical protein [Thermoanaerobaculia bacterium]
AELEPAEIVEPPPAPEADDTAAEDETASFHEAVEEALDAPGDEDLVEVDDDGEEPSVDLVAEPPPPDVSAPEEPEVEALEPDTPADAQREAGGGGESADSDTQETAVPDFVDDASSTDTEAAAPPPTDIPLTPDDSDLDAEMSEPLGGETQLDDESRRRIADLLEEGQNAYDAGEYQSAIDAWSRIFLIDIDHEEANRRIEQARRMSAEVERQVEEVFHEAMASLDSGDLDEAREALNRVLDLQPGHLAAKDYLERIESGDVRPGAETGEAVEESPLTPAGFDLTDTAEVELQEGEGEDEDAEQLFTTPELTEEETVGQATAPMPSAPTSKKGPSRNFLLLGSAVLVVVLLGGWWLIDNWDLFFPNSQAVQQSEPAPRIDPIARAKALHEQGKTAIAIAQLRRLPPGDPSYAEAQALVAQWETPEGQEAPQGPSEAERRRQQELVERARRALAAGENILTLDLLERAAAIAPLDAETEGMRDRARLALEPLREQIRVFRSGDWEYALPTLWRMREQDSDNRDVNRLIVDSYYNLGVRDLQRGRPEAALRKFEEALSVRPGDPVLERLAAFAGTYADDRPEDLLYRIFVKYLPFR